MEASDLIDRYPNLYHMADHRAWEGIVRHGLLSTTALLDLYEVRGGCRVRIEASIRPEIVTLEHPEHGTAFIRDNRPLNQAKLENALEPGMSADDFLRLLNRKVFFWLTPGRLAVLLGARAYRDREHLVLTVDTERLIKEYRDAVTLSPINSGSTVFKAAPRGSETFRSIAEYDYDSRRKARGPRDAIAELAVDYGVPDIVDFTLRAEIRHPNGSVEIVHE